MKSIDHVDENLSVSSLLVWVIKTRRIENCKIFEVLDVHTFCDGLHILASFESMTLLKALALFLELLLDDEVASGALTVAHFSEEHQEWLAPIRVLGAVFDWLGKFGHFSEKLVKTFEETILVVVLV